MIKKRKNIFLFRSFRHKSLVFPMDDGSFVRLKHTVMNDDIKYLHLCAKLLTGKNIESSYADRVEVDNILYQAFGMSSDDIKENLCQNIDNATIFY